MKCWASHFNRRVDDCSLQDHIMLATSYYFYSICKFPERGQKRGGLLWGVHSSLYTGDVHGWVWNENPLYFSTSIIVIIFLKVDLRNSNTTTIWTFVLEWYVVRGGSKNEPYKRRVFKRDQTTCSKYATHCIGQLNEHENLRFNDK